jgi:hypothetical protein
MYPFGFDVVEPGTFGGQATGQQATPAFLFDFAVVRFDKSTHLFADVPRGIVPDHQESLLAFSLQRGKRPRKEMAGHRTDRSSVHKAQEHLPGIVPQQAIAGKRNRIRIGCIGFFSDQTQRLGICPSMKVGLCQSREPDLILETKYPVRMSIGKANQSFSPLFLRV